MAQFSDKRDDSTPSINNAVQHIQKVVALESGDAANGDNIEVFGVPVSQKWRLVRAVLRVSDTLGANSTLTMKVESGGTRTAITGATTAGGASMVETDADSDVPMDIDGGDVIELTVGGADIAAAANATVDLFYSNREG